MALPSIVFAQGGLLEGISCIQTGSCQLIDILRLGRNISNFILRYVGVVVLIFLIVGGIIWITASGNPERIKKGKGIIVGSLIGMFIVFFAWQAVDLVICTVTQGKITESCQIFGQRWHVFPGQTTEPGQDKKCWELGDEYRCVSSDLCKLNTVRTESCVITGLPTPPGVVCCQPDKDCKQYGENYECLYQTECKADSVKGVCLWEPFGGAVKTKACCEPKDQ